ncbi:MAG: cation-translocating P-type ATPase [Candidatus Thermoplasmatota archaeon]|nr:cation-translocating P-type ATPase [Candidatus Thermoplasmatota archaeon]
MDGEDEFILIEDENEENPPSVTPSPEIANELESAPISEKVALRDRFTKLKEGLSEQVDAVKDRLKPRMVDVESEALAEAADLSLEIDGYHTFEWPIKGMDCPDCAAKAKRATQRLPGVKKVAVSVTMGTISIDIDLGEGHTSKVSAVMTSLGHEPDITWQRIMGVTATGLAEKNGVDRRELRKMLMQIAGILEVRFEDASVEIQTVPLTEKVLIDELTNGLNKIVGGQAVLREVQNRRLDNGQWRLVSSVPAILILFGILIMPERYQNQNLLMLLTLVGVGLSGWRMFLDAWGGIKNKELGFQLLTSLAVIGAFFGQHWSEALMVSILVAIAAHMEESALLKAREAMQGGLDRLPRRARRVGTSKKITGISMISSVQNMLSQSPSEHGSTDDENMISVELLEKGDRVEIRSGEIVPVDGIVIDGIGSLNRAPLTGESIPVRVSKGEEVHAGLVLDRGPIVVESTAVGNETRLSGLIDEVRTFRDRPPRVQGSIEKFSKWWVPIVLVGAPLAGLVMNDVRLTLLLWVVACPCALLLAAPVPHAAALSTAAMIGIIARGGDALEAASGVDLALLDKTGTLTSGQPKLCEIRLAKSQKRENILRLAAGLEQRSNHPYAAVILQEASDVGTAEVTALKDGDAGVEGKHSGKKVMFGRADWLVKNGVTIPEELLENLDPSLGVSVLSKDGKAIAAFSFIHDDLRPGAAEMIHDLQSMGVAVELLSGDIQEAVEALGKEIGIPPMQCRGEIDPEGKAMWVERRSQGRRTLMAGDGFNDASALAVADIGVAVGSGEQVNLDAADVLIPGEDPRAITSLIRIAKRTHAVVQFNILISILVTALLVGAVMSGMNSITIAVLVHEMSAFLVILNGAFIASSGNRLSLLGSVLSSIVRDYSEAFKLLFSKKSSSPTHD